MSNIKGITTIALERLLTIVKVVSKKTGVTFNIVICEDQKNVGLQYCEMVAYYRTEFIAQMVDEEQERMVKSLLNWTERIKYEECD